MLKTSLSLKSFILFLRNVAIIIPYLILDAKEPQIFMLQQVYDITHQKFAYSNHMSLMCKPYGVRTLQEIMQMPKTSPYCKEKFTLFFQNHPHASYFAHTLLHLRAFYPLYMQKDGRCLVSVKGMKSYSEVLLENGLAVVEKGLLDEENLYRLQRAQERAQRNKKGLFSNPETTKCVMVSYF